MAPPIIRPPSEQPPFNMEDVEDVKRLALRPGDVLVLRSSRPVTREWMQSCYANLKQYFPDHHVIVLGPDVDLGVMGPDEEGPANGRHSGEIGLN